MVTCYFPSCHYDNSGSASITRLVSRRVKISKAIRVIRARQQSGTTYKEQAEDRGWMAVEGVVIMCVCVCVYLLNGL